MPTLMFVFLFEVSFLESDSSNSIFEQYEEKRIFAAC